MSRSTASQLYFPPEPLDACRLVDHDALVLGLAHMKVPTHILSGDEDNQCLDPGIFIKRACPAAGLSVVPATGHAVNVGSRISLTA